MYIYCNSNSEKTYVRFGKRFKHGKSINYLAMNPRVKELYSSKLTELQYGHITEEEFNAWCEDALDSFVWETSISCFDCDPKTKLPVIHNLAQAKDLIARIAKIERGEICETFLIKGEQVGIGTDKEPLVNVTYEEPIEYNIDDLIDIAVDALSQGFEDTHKTEDWYTDDLEHIGSGIYVYKDNMFMFPIREAVVPLDYKGPVMDKFKYETEVEVDPDDVQSIFIPANSEYQNYDDIKDATYDWGDNIYDQTYYFENKYRIAVEITRDKDIYICGSEDMIWEFTNDFAVEYEEIEPPADLVKKYLSMKFYE